ncbi:InlB B-repeat-containing protein [Chloroflexus sp.]|uniref:InlB B-repeat-containing protein n=1 Tax=Chloroflexus sp. TaxID=1904827 RepID=UPI003D141061
MNKRNVRVGRQLWCQLLRAVLVLAMAAGLWASVFHELARAQTSFTLTITGMGLGSGVVSNAFGINCTITAGVPSGSCTQSYPSGTYVSLNAIPAPGSAFVRWLGDCSGTSPNIMAGPIDRNMTCTAWFAPPVTVFEEGFDQGIPTTWQIVDGGNNAGNQAARTWTTNNPGNRNFGPPFDPPFAIVDSDAAGPGATQDEQLITPWISVASCPGKVFVSYADYMHGGKVELADTDILTGTTWVRLHWWSGNSFPVGPQITTLHLTPKLGGATSFRLRWHYYNTSNELYWAIDSVRVFCEPPIPPGGYPLYLPLVVKAP